MGCTGLLHVQELVYCRYLRILDVRNCGLLPTAWREIEESLGVTVITT